MGVLMVGGGDSLVDTYTLLFLSLLNSSFGATAVRRPGQRGRFWNVCASVCMCGANAACACVRGSEWAVLEISSHLEARANFTVITI